LLLEHQIIIGDRSRRRDANLTTLDRFVLGLTMLFIRPHRISTVAALLKPATLLKFHKALVARKYRLLTAKALDNRPGYRRVCAQNATKWCRAMPPYARIMAIRETNSLVTP